MEKLLDIFRGFWQSLLLSGVPIVMLFLAWMAIQPIVLVLAFTGFTNAIPLVIVIVFCSLLWLCVKFADGKYELIGACLFFACLPTIFFAWNWQQNRSIPKNLHVHYYRFVADLVVDGNPLTINVVVRCGVRIGSPPGGGTSEDVMQTSAYVYAVRVSGDHAVKVRTSGNPQEPVQPCSGATTANGRVPRNWLPLVVWYDRADELARGLGYATQDAYHSPSSRLGFKGAKIEMATAEDFDHFMKTGSKNLVPPHLADSMSHLDAPRFGSPQAVPQAYLARPEQAWTFATSPRCRGVNRVRLTEQQRSETRVLAPNNQSVQDLWPAAKPRFWLPASIDWRMAFSSYVLTMEQKSHFKEIYDPRPLEEGGYQPPAIYPVGSSEALEGLATNPTRVEPPYYEAFIGDGVANRGFVYCDAEAPPAMTEALLKRPLLNNGQDGIRRCKADGKLLPRGIGHCDLPGLFSLETDEYAITAIFASQG